MYSLKNSASNKQRINTLLKIVICIFLLCHVSVCVSDFISKILSLKGGFFMSNNILEPVVNSLSEALKVGLKYLYKVMNIKPYFDIIDFFKEIELKNKKGQYPTLVKIYESQKGYTYLLGVPAGLSTDDFLKVKGALQIQLKNNIEIRERKGYIEVEAITVELPSKIDYKVPARVKDSICIPFANSLNGAVYLDLKETPHTLVTGATGSGKSITTRNIITSILNLYPNEVNLYLIDFKIVELSIYKNLSRSYKHL